MATPLPSSGRATSPWPDEWFETVAACLWCGAEATATQIAGVRDWFFQAVPGEFSFALCPSCSSLVLQRRPVQAHIAKAYQGYYTHAEPLAAKPRAGALRRVVDGLAHCYARHQYGGSAGWPDRVGAAAFGLLRTRRAEADAAYRYLPCAPAEVLDYGCGNGDFLERAAALGHRVTGVDFDAEAVAVAQRRGLAVLEPSAINPADFSARFDHISAAHVLEHVADPVALLRDFRSWLKPGGQLFVELPNALAAGLHVHGHFWRGLEAPRHFSLPSEQGLRMALHAAGFVPVSVGQRAFARHFMDAVSSAAAQAHGGPLAVGSRQTELTGPEMLTCLAKAI